MCGIYYPLPEGAWRLIYTSKASLQLSPVHPSLIDSLPPSDMLFPTTADFGGKIVNNRRYDVHQFYDDTVKPLNILSKLAIKIVC